MGDAHRDLHDADRHVDRRHDTDENIERLIREADKQAALEPVDVTNLPMQPMFWHVLVEPMRASAKIGSGVLYQADESKRVEEIQTTIGRLVAIGPCAFTGKTNAGNFLGEGIEREKLINRWVMYAKHTGQEIKLRTGHRLLLLNDSELLAFVENPEDFRHWL
jgi:co-chaperonin GroES (HSP10)